MMRTDGILLVDKQEGETSYDVIRKLRCASGMGKGFKAGHAGTLDPFATGLLIILVGQGTKLSDFLMAWPKMYRAIITLGIETDTLDPTGQIMASQSVPCFTKSHICDVAKEFTGEIEQMTPVFSAARIGGRRSYCLARQGMVVKPRKRKVWIRSLKITSFDLPDIAMEVECSSGTYIRSIAADLGKKLGPGGHLKNLRRTRNGPFEVSDAIPSSEINTDNFGSRILGRLISLNSALPGMQAVQLDNKLVRKIRQGYQPPMEELGNTHFELQKGYVKLVRADELVAISEVKHSSYSDDLTMRTRRVFF
jgi:tRNA pseudouridine55 synthase